MTDETNNDDTSENPEKSGSSNGDDSKKMATVHQFDSIKVKELADEVKAGDDALNKLKIQNLDFILDIPLTVTVELGRTNYLIKDLLSLGQGSVMELNKMAGEHLEILVNGKLIAKGEVVVVNEKFGVRIKDIISPVERIETLK
jgi:flagellar motor switch protein FliN/FliY